jgi:hypothetical protein
MVTCRMLTHYGHGSSLLRHKINYNWYLHNNDLNQLYYKWLYEQY